MMNPCQHCGGPWPQTSPQTPVGLVCPDCGKPWDARRIELSDGRVIFVDVDDEHSDDDFRRALEAS